MDDVPSQARNDVFQNLSEETRDLLAVSRDIYDKEAQRLIDEQGDTQDHLYKLMRKRTGITDPYLRGHNAHINALESGKAPMKDLQLYFDAEIQELKEQLNERNNALSWWALKKELVEVPEPVFCLK